LPQKDHSVVAKPSTVVVSLALIISKESPMREYRCYLLDGRGVIRFVHALRCEHDCDALTLAREMLEGHLEYHGMELWHGRRRVYVEGSEAGGEIARVSPELIHN
jgi:hypothetical protein